MAKDKYEISLWEDIYIAAGVSGAGSPAHYEEQKLCVIGSDTMTAQCRAIEPKFTRNVNGKNTFTFKMFYIYRDDKTGQMYDNPFLKLLVNERKVKVLWQDEWYDLVIKNIQEASNGKSMVFTCEDANINELAKSGFELTFDDELNTIEFTNQGTAEELGRTVLEGTDWEVDAEAIPQYNEEPVFLITIKDNENIPAVNQLTSKTITLEQGDKILIYYNQLVDLYNSVLDPNAGTISSSTRYLQFAYAEDEFVQDQNNQLVINAACYKTSNPVTVRVANSTNPSAINGKTIRIAFDTHTYDLYNLSTQYRAKRLIESTKTVIDQYVDSICEVYTGNSTPGSGLYAGKIRQNDIIHKHVGTVFEGAKYAMNLAANPSNFIKVSGWDGIIRKGNSSYTYEAAAPDFGYWPNRQESVINEHTFLTLCGAGRPNNCYYFYYNDAIRASYEYFKDGVALDDRYIVRLKLRKGAQGNSTSPGAYATASDFTTETTYSNLYPFVSTYKIDGSTQHKRPLNDSDEETSVDYFRAITNQPEEIGNTHYLQWELRCTTPFKSSQLSYKNIGFFFRIVPPQKDGAYLKLFVEELQIFKKVLDENDNLITPGDFDKNAIAQVKYQYYNFTKFYEDYQSGQATLENINDYYLYRQVDDWDYGNLISPILVPGFQKIRSINISKSNRFNILQTIAETFQCWIKFEVEHDSTGKIVYDNRDGHWRLQKNVKIVNEIGEDRGLGFVYGIDVQNIQRTVESNQIVTKTIVLPNDNEFATHGQCRISRSQLNAPLTDYIFNFDYYTSHALLDKDQLFNDLYINTITDEEETTLVAEGFYYWMHRWNADYEEKSEEYANKMPVLIEDEALLKTYSELMEAAAQTILDEQEWVAYIVSKEGQSWSDIMTYLTTPDAKYDNKLHCDDAEIKPHLVAITSQERLQEMYTGLVQKLQIKIEQYRADIQQLQLDMKDLSDKIRLKSQAFYKKYAAFISEGSWTDQKYMDDNLYYIDAQSVAYTSSRPKVSYNISVLRLTGLEQFKDKDFSLGEIAFVQDTEFFGYSDAARTTPYKEKVLISEITYNFDEPAKDSFKVQNYKTQFEDLFQRIAAATQSLQFNEGIYARAGEAISADGTLNQQFLEDTFDENSAVLNRTSLNQSVITDERGVTVKSLVDPANIVRITSGGIFITDDAGETWKNAVRGDGVSTKYLTAGQIDTSIIQIIDGKNPTFRWDSNGISAYEQTKINNVTSINYTKFVRMDQYGFYGTSSAPSSWVPSSEDNVRHTAKFGATWKGFFINGAVSSTATGTVFYADDSGNLHVTGDITANNLYLGSNAAATLDSRYTSESQVQALIEAGTTTEALGLDSWATSWASGHFNDIAFDGKGSNLTGAVPLSYVTGDMGDAMKVIIAEDGTVGTLPSDYEGDIPSGKAGFAIQSNGVIVANHALIYGTIFASAGLIGGWEINGKSIHKDWYDSTNDETYWVRLAVPTNAQPDASNRAFLVRKAAGPSVPSSGGNDLFAVFYDGSFRATTGFIGGTNATANNAWRIGDGKIRYGVLGTAKSILLDAFAENSMTIGSTSPSSVMLAVGSQFAVNKNGVLYCTGAVITGKITATQLTVTPSLVSGLAAVATTGNYDDLSVKPTIPDVTGFYRVGNVITPAGPSGQKPASGTYFTVSSQGLLEAQNAIIYGTIYAGAGEIGGWKINTLGLTRDPSTEGGTDGVCLGVRKTTTSTPYAFLAGWNGSPSSYASAKCRIGNDGVATFEEVRAKGGFIGTSAAAGWTISSNKLVHGSNNSTGYFVLNADGNTTATINNNSRDNLSFVIGNKLAIVNTGKIICSEIQMEGGSLSINYQEGIKGCQIDSNGNLYANSGTFKGTVSAGTVSGCTIQGSTIYLSRAAGGTDGYGEPFSVLMYFDYNSHRYAVGIRDQDIPTSSTAKAPVYVWLLR